MTSPAPTANSFTMTHVFDAPRDLVFRMWTDPNHVAWWWGPHNFSLTVHEMDVRPGGTWRYTMHGPDGTDYEGTVLYTIVDPPSHLAYQHDRPRVDVSVTLSASQGADNREKTLLSATMTRPEPIDPRDDDAWAGARVGIGQALVRLARHLAAYVGSTSAEPTIVVTREFDAPRALVWKAHTDPEMMRAWWGPHGYENEEVTMDVRPGGAWRVVQRARDGVRHIFGGVYRELDPPERMVGTFVWGGKPDEELLTTTTYEELPNNRTRMHSTTILPSVEARDTMLSYGAIGGQGQSYERLDGVLRRSVILSSSKDAS